MISPLAQSTGFLVGPPFSWLHPPNPAPASLPGIPGAAGCFAGSVPVGHFRL